MKRIILLFTLCTSLLYSQDTGIISGKVTDEVSREPIIGANILIEGTDLGAAADINGEFKIINVPAGTYNVRASVIGYSPLVKTDVVIRPSQPAVLEFQMQEAIIELEGIVVNSGGYFDNQPHELNSVRTFGYEEIRRTPGGFEDVVRALSVLPGVAQAGAGRNDLIVRGGAPSENLYTLDGIEIPNINHFGTQGAGGGALSYINLDFVRETSFSTGGFSVLNGDKLSSTLTIDLRDGRADRLGGKGTISATQFGLNLEGPISSKSSFLFSARRSYLDFIFKAAGFGFVPEYWDITGKADFELDNRNSLSYLFISAIDNVKWFNDTEDQLQDNSRVLGTDQVQYTTGLTFRHLIDHGLVNVVLSRSYVDYNSVQRDTLLNPIYQNISLEAENTLAASLVYKLSKTAELNAGVSGKLIKYDADILLPAFVTTFGDTLPYTSVDYSDYFTKAAAYININNVFFDRIKTNLGVRGDYFDNIEQKIYFSPRASASYSFNDLTSISISGGVYYQAPSYLWLSIPENRTLRSVRAEHLILGFDHLLREDALIKIELYQKWYSDYPASLLRTYLLLANTGAGYQGSEDNFSSFGLEPLASDGTGISRGVEFSLQKKLSDMRLYGIMSVTVGETKFTPIDDVSRTGAYNQDIIVSLSGGYKFNDYWEASLKFRYSAGTPFTPYEPDGTQLMSKYLTEIYPPVHSLDIRADRRWYFGRYTLITYVDIQNIYNNKQTNNIRWDPETQTAESVSSIGILPSIGVSLEF